MANYHKQFKHQLFVYTLLKDQTALFQITQFSMSFVCSQFKCQTVLFDSLIWTY